MISELVLNAKGLQRHNNLADTFPTLEECLCFGDLIKRKYPADDRPDDVFALPFDNSVPRRLEIVGFMRQEVQIKPKQADIF